MKASAIAYWAAKEGSSASEYEDAWQVSPDACEEIPGDSVSVAVADGATESLLARPWATMVVRAFAANPGAASDSYLFAETVAALSERWPNLVNSYITERENAGKPLRWYERPGISKGAFATLLLLQVDIGSEYSSSPDAQTTPELAQVIGRWHSVALGDTCLFHVRDGKIEAAVPLDESSKFNTSPTLLASSNIDSNIIANHLQFATGTVAEGDDFFVCTDALAAWFLARAEEGSFPWETLRDLNEISFEEWVAEARSTGGLRNDDVTLVHLDIW